ncbi:PblB [Streptococcus pneumoniae]|nr:PblB [Streptococcus pneumoniae]CVZ87973.1 PblB [Streptococcus pneumoniae]CWE57305.1 PblB [Streptococcus pneumoniae]CWM10243.1 PblB [Streptococcus pneumoniae]VJL54076.1 PblB [Streptococcus pneumoniae]
MCLVMVGIPKAEGMRLFGGIRSVAVARRLKENITDTAVKALDKINRLRMVAFDFIENKKHEEIGLIAQEAETIVPRIVSRDPENPDGYLHIDYTALVPYLIKAIQELNQKIEKMEKTIA